MAHHSRDRNSPILEQLEDRLLLTAGGGLLEESLAAGAMAATGSDAGPVGASIQSLHPNFQNSPLTGGAQVLYFGAIPDYDWWYGCVPTAAGMLTAYWDFVMKVAYGADAAVYPGGNPWNWQYGAYPGGDDQVSSEAFLVPDYANGAVSGWAHQQEAVWSIDDGWVLDTYDGHLPDSIADFILTESFFDVTGYHRSETSTDYLAQGMMNFLAWDDLRTSQNESWSSTATYYTVGGDPNFDFGVYAAEIAESRPMILILEATAGPYLGQRHAVLGAGYTQDGTDSYMQVFTTWGVGPQEWLWRDLGAPTGEGRSGYGFQVVGGLGFDEAITRNEGLTGYFAVSTPVAEAITAEICLGDPDPASALWSTTAYAGGGGQTQNLLVTDVDLSGALPHLGTTEDWYLVLSGGSGRIMDFQIRYGEQRWFTPEREKLHALDTYVQVTSGVMGAISGVVWEDLNGDGQRQAGEPGVPGVTVFIDTDENGQLGTAELSAGESGLLLIIGDGATEQTQVAVTGLVGIVTDVDVTIDQLIHTRCSDLRVSLTSPPTAASPSGVEVILFSGVGGAGQNFTGTVLDDEASTPIASGAAPFTGSFQPQGLLSAFDGMSANGAWTLTIQDMVGGNGFIGALLEWSVDFTIAEPFATTNADGEYVLSDVPSGYHVVAAVVPSGWVQTGPIGGVYHGVVGGEAVENVDFGIARVGSISGFVFSDLDHSGVKDGGEPGLADWTVYIDANQNGLLDDDEQSDITDGTGAYSFADLAPGTYYLAEVLVDGWVPTQPVPPDVHVVLDLVSGVDATGENFGNYLPDLPDLVDGGDGNSSFTPTLAVPGDAWVANWRVSNAGPGNAAASRVDFYASADQTIDVQVDYLLGSRPVGEITAGGFEDVVLDLLSFPTIPPGEYYVGVVLDAGGDNAEGVAGEANNVAFDLDTYPLTVAGIKGVVWHDLNNDTVRAGGEPLLEGWTVYLDRNQNGALDAGEERDTTNAYGEYSFAGLPAGPYIVREVVPPGWTLSRPASGSYAFTLVTGQVADGFDFGNYRPDLPDLYDDGDQFSRFEPTAVVSPGGSLDVWWDVRNGGAAAAGGFWVDFYVSVDDQIDPAEDYLLGRERVAGIPAGGYRDINLSLLGFPAVPAGNYYVGVIIDADNEIIELNEDNNVGVDYDHYALGVVNRPELHVTGAAASGFDPTIVSPGQLWDAWFEVENSGLAGAGPFQVDFYASSNPGITPFDHFLGHALVPGLAAGQAVQVALSLFQFPQIPAGRYYVGVIIDQADVVEELDETNNKGTDDYYPLLVPGIEGHKWHDVDYDGVTDAGEPPLPGFVVYVDANANDQLDWGEVWTTTDADGVYSFTSLPAGSHRITEAARSLWYPSYPSPDPVHVVDLAADGLVTDVNFGNVQASKVGAAKWHDRDGSGTYDPGAPQSEALLDSWTISTFQDANANGRLDPAEQPSLRVGLTGTILSGSVTFPDLLPGRFVVQETLPAATPRWMQTWPLDEIYVAPLTSAVLYGANNFGNAHPVTLGGLKWNDLNGDTIRNAGEPGLEGWVIYLDLDYDPQIPQSDLDPGEPWTTTDTSGRYLFTGLKPGTYYVFEELQDGWAQSIPYNPAYTVTGWGLQAWSGESWTFIDFGNYQPGEIRGTKFHDIDGDGVFKEASEPGIEDWIITLYDDADEDGVLDPADPVVTTTTTDSLGNYSFPNLVPGYYIVAEDLPPAWRQSAPGPATGGTHAVLITSGLLVEELDFGNYIPAEVSGFKFEDINGDGQQGPADPPRQGWTIFLDQNDNGVLDGGERSTTTDEFGQYLFDGLVPGPYYVAEVVQPNWMQTYPAGGASHSVILQSGDVVTDLDFRNFQYVTIRGSKWHDLDADGLRDAGEPGLEGWTIYVDEDDNGQFDPGEPSALTDATGAYSIGGLGPGAHIVAEVLQGGWQQSAPAGGDYLETVTSGQVLTGRNFGNYQYGQIEGTKWWGVESTGLEGWTIYADLNGNGAYNAGEPSDVTDASGEYALVGLRPGTYYVREVLRSGWVRTDPASGYYQVTITSGQVVSGIDFRNIEAGEIHGYKWHDVDGNGIRDAGETGLPGWTISAFLDANGNGQMDGTEAASLVTATTSTTGDYVFTGLLPGTYVVAEFFQQDWVQTFPAGGVHQVPVSRGEIVTNIHFGNARPATIAGRKWYDDNADGIRQQPGEPALQDWIIYLDTNANGQRDPAEPFRETGENGEYLFEGLVPGMYLVAEELQAGWAQSAPAGGVHQVTLTSGLTVSNVDFGNYEPGEIHGQKWHDVDADGVWDVGEPALADWTIYLDQNGNGVLDAGERSTTTAGDGSYAFTDLALAATYTVAEVVPVGWGQSYPADPGTYTVTPIRGDREFYGRDFGNYQQVSIQGGKYHDVDHDRDWGGGEPGLEGWVIFLDVDLDGIYDIGEPYTTTDANGAYSFTGLSPGTYGVVEVVRPGWAQTAPAAQSHSLTLTSGMAVTDADFGNERTPEVQDLSIVTDEDTPVAGVVTGTDAEGDDIDFAVADPPQHGAAQMAADGTFTYTPGQDYNGADSFTFVGSDDFGDSLPGRVSVTVRPVNDAPVASNLTEQVNEDESRVLYLQVQDVETAAAALVYEILDLPDHGTLVPMGLGRYRYRPDPNYHGPDAFTYAATDRGDPDGSYANPSELSSNVATVDITVAAVNDLPVGQDLEVSTAQNIPVDVTLLGSDLETPAAELTYSIATQPASGQVTVLGDVATYTPSAGWVGEDTFTYLVHDTGDPPGSGSDASLPATVRVRVVPAYEATSGRTLHIGQIAITLYGPGKISVFPAYYFSGGQQEINQIVATGTTQASSIRIQTLWARLGDVIIHGSLGMFTANSVELLGDFIVDGSLRSARIERLSGGTFRIGAPANPWMGAMLTFGRLTDVNIESDTPIMMFRADEWLDTDAVADVLRAPWIGSMFVSGAFQAGLQLTGAGARFNSLGFARIGGNLTGADWDINGRVGSVFVTGLVNDWRLFSTANALTRVTSLMLGDVVTADLIINGTLGTVRATRWQGGSIRAAALQTLMVLGRGYNGIRGDFGAQLILTGHPGARPWQLSLGMARIAGNVTGFSAQSPLAWSVTGNVGTLYILGAVANWNLNVNSDLRYLRLGIVTNANVTVAGGCLTAYATQWLSGKLQAQRVQSLMITGAFRGAQGDFGADLNLTNAGGRQTLGYGRIAGQASGTWNVAGNAGSLSLGSTASSFSASFSGDVMYLRTSGSLRGGLQARSIRTMFVGGDLDGADVRLTGGVNPQRPWYTVLGNMMVGGWMRDSQFRSQGNVGNVAMVGMVNSSFFAGVKDAVTALPASRGDFLAIADSLLPGIGGFNVRSNRHPYAFINSNVAAWAIRTVSLNGVQTDNGGVEFGLATHSLGSLTRRDGTSFYRWPNASEPAGPAPDGDFVVRLV